MTRSLRLLLDPQNYGRPFAAPAGVPPDRLDALRSAFRQTLEDAAFLAEANKAQLEIRYTSPDHIQSSIQSAFDAPEAVRQRAIGVLLKAAGSP